jgi:hypothetical protein
MLRLGGFRFKASLGKYFETPPISKIARAKWTGGVAEAAEHLLCKTKQTPELLIFNTSSYPP